MSLWLARTFIRRQRMKDRQLKETDTNAWCTLFRRRGDAELWLVGNGLRRGKKCKPIGTTFQILPKALTSIDLLSFIGSSQFERVSKVLGVRRIDYVRIWARHGAVCFQEWSQIFKPFESNQFVNYDSVKILKQ